MIDVELGAPIACRCRIVPDARPVASQVGKPPERTEGCADGTSAKKRGLRCRAKRWGKLYRQSRY